MFICKTPWSLYLCFMVIMLVACREEVIQDFPDFKPVPNINAILVCGEPMLVNVSLADKLDTASLNIVNNAIVSLYANGNFVEELSYISSGFYKSSVLIEPITEYTCKVKMVDHEEISIIQILPTFPKILNIEHTNIAGKNEEGTSYPSITIDFENLQSISLYYEVEIRFFRSSGDETETGIAKFHSYEDPVILNEGLPIPLFCNEIIEDKQYQLHLNYTTNGSMSFNNGPMRAILHPFVVELRQVTEDYYRYKKQLYLYKEGRYADGIITSMTNANLYSNVNNGYGIFAGYSSIVSDTITPNLDGYYD